jgi:hypothetical protein
LRWNEVVAFDGEVARGGDFAGAEAEVVCRADFVGVAFAVVLLG